MLSLVAAALLLAEPAAAATANVTPIDPDRKVRCQREEVTGSLIAAKKVCHTVAEWRKMADAAQNDAERVQEMGRICPACQGR